MPATVLTTEAARAANIEIIENGIGTQAVHDMVVAMRANRRSGTANTKTRAEVRGSNAKPWRQKGTGRARAGTKQSPIWRGGGVVFGPKPRSYAKDVNKKTRKLAFRKALSERILAGDVLTVPSFDIADGKTKSFVREVTGLVDSAKKVLIVGAKFEDSTYLSGRNVAATLLITADEVNVEQLLYNNKIIITDSAFETLARRTSQ
ncbi:MAG: large subunit ribosomal protein L4 [Pseudoalteromonas tetraodonis]|jgi:large subunit ribosomal protein L4